VTDRHFRFLVWKQEDLKKAGLSEEEWNAISSIQHKLFKLRGDEGRTPVPVYLVVNEDEPYAGDVLNIIKENEGEK